MRLGARLKFKVRGLQRFADILASDFRGSGTGPFRAAMTKWGLRYRTFIYDRFVLYSGGGGDWPPIKPGTAKRKGGTEILIDTGAMFASLEPTFDARSQDVRSGVRVSFGSTDNHPTANMSYRSLIEIHQFGLGNNPVRTIIVPPDNAVVKEMKQDMLAAIREAKKLARR